MEGNFNFYRNLLIQKHGVSHAPLVESFLLQHEELLENKKEFTQVNKLFSQLVKKNNKGVKMTSSNAKNLDFLRQAVNGGAYSKQKIELPKEEPTSVPVKNPKVKVKREEVQEFKDFIEWAKKEQPKERKSSEQKTKKMKPKPKGPPPPKGGKMEVRMIYQKGNYEKNFIQKLEKYIQSQDQEDQMQDSFSSIEKFKKTTKALPQEPPKQDKSSLE